MSKFKLGDKVEVIEKRDGRDYIGRKGIIVRYDGLSFPYLVDFSQDGSRDTWWYREVDIKLINNIKTMNTLQKFALIFKSEPQKSYRKAGITNGDDVITDEGMKIYLTYLLNKDTNFKAEIVDELLKEEEKDN